MKKVNVLVLGFVMTLGLSACIKEGDSFDPAAQYAIEKPIIEEYAKSIMINPKFDEPTGIWYEVLAEGNPESYVYKAEASGGQHYPEVPTYTLKYSGKLLNGTVFETKDSQEMKFSNNIIRAWIAIFFPKTIRYDLKGDPLNPVFEFGGLTENGLKEGSKVRFVTPSFMAYGNAANGSIPPNSPLHFDVEVLDIKVPTSAAN